MAGLPERPPADRSNSYQGIPEAEQLGQKFFFDARFSGVATQMDTLRRPVPYARSAKGQPVALSCASCHDGARAGIDTSSVPGHVSVGAGWFDVNAQPTVNASYYELAFWNGRADSMWAQALLATEGAVAMNGSRLATAWTISDLYRDEYQAVFASYPVPMEGPSSAVKALLDTEAPRVGQCKLDAAGACAAPCRQAEDGSCWPRFPLAGKPGTKMGCQGGDPAEPAGDAWDCMAKEDRDEVLRMFVNFGKAIAAFEARLVSRNSAFDRFVADGPSSTAISASARRGAHLFIGKAACSDCHGTPLLADNKFHDIGVPQVGPAVPTVGDCPAGGVCDCVELPATTAADGTPVPAKDANNCLPWGGRDGLAKLRRNAFRRDSVWSDDPTDNTRQRWVDGGPDMAARGAWRTPSLRDVALTGPYMHDGVYQTLDEVVAHYARGGNADAVGGRAPEIRPLFLDAQEQVDLVEFLKTLTGEPLSLEMRKAPVLP
jgi:cytochrome c peroxidase